MLVLDKEYIVIDAEKTPVQITKWVEFETGGKQQTFNEYRLRLSFTIQCNGRLRRSTVDLDTVQPVDAEKDEITTVNGYGLKDYRPAYAVFDLLRDLGYDVGDEFEVNKIIMDALAVFEEDELTSVVE